jgi:hypothetical protein
MVLGQWWKGNGGGTMKRKLQRRDYDGKAMVVGL